MMTKKLAAEFLGTGWLVFGGCGSAVLAAAFPSLGIGFTGVSLAFASSAVVASRLAHDVIYHGVSLLSLKVVLAGFVLLVVAVCIAPLLALVGPLVAAKRRGLLEYGALVGEHGRLVRRRWILREAPEDNALLQAPEIGPVADTLALYEAVSRMKPVPFGKSTLLGLAVPTLIPILVLLSTQVPIKEVLKKIVGALL